MFESRISRHGVPIRLPDERWAHIINEHQELMDMRNEVLDAISTPDRIVAGTEQALLAVRSMEQGKVLVVVYRETADYDGFVITAFITRRLATLDRRQQTWPPPNYNNT